MSVKTFLGMNAKLYRNTGSYGSPTWTEVSDVKDLKIGLESAEADQSIRGGGGWEAVAAALKKASVEFGMLYDTADTNWTAFQAAWLNSTAIEIACMDGPIATVGTQGFRMTVAVLKFDQTENLADAIHNEVTCKPTRADNPPSSMTIAA